ncbi:MAG: thiopurine S-methyltransferase [Pseudomonadales bacterium]
MDHKAWLDRWSNNRIGFHQPQPNRWLVQHWETVQAQGAVFVPLCGKSLDMRYLEGLGHRVIGIDLARIALEAYFEEGGEQVLPSRHQRLERFEGARSTLFCGDFFDLTSAELEGVDTVYDRGALVALPRKLRAQYADHLLQVTDAGVRILLVTIEYDQGLVAGPPFSVLPEEVDALYGARAEVRALARTVTSEVPPHFAEQGVRSATEAVYLLNKRY